MSPIEPINVAANVLLVGSTFHMIMKVFGDPESVIYKRPWGAIACKAAMCVTLCGALANIATLSTPSWTECMLNVGVSLNFLWISYFIESKPTVNRPKVPDPTLSPSNTQKVSRRRKPRHPLDD